MFVFSFLSCQNNKKENKVIVSQFYKVGPGENPTKNFLKIINSENIFLGVHERVKYVQGAGRIVVTAEKEKIKKIDMIMSRIESEGLSSEQLKLLNEN